MLWTPYSRQTCSGTIFATWTSAITSLQASEFDLGPLLSAAVAAESDEQEDSEPHDALNDIDEEWPPNPLNDIDEDWPPQDPWNEVDDLPDPPTAKKRRASPSFDDVVAAGPPQKGNHRRRALKRARKIAEVGFTPRASTLREHVQPAQPIQAPSFNASTLPTVHGAYAAKVEGQAEKRGGKQRRSLAELIGLGFQLVRWDGLAARPLVDNAGRIFAVLAGQPDNSKWHAAVARAYDSIKTEGSNAQFPPAMLLGNADINRLTNFASFAFSMWAPQLYSHYVEKQREGSNVTLAPPSAIPEVRRSVWTFKHRDVCNLPFGWCAIQSLGRFDATKGGHLVLWDLKLVIEFPAGALILLPSATLAHSNVPVADGQERISFTQYTSGGLFRWIDNGGRTA
ncbi:hypothetical protein B0H14DRAFT_2601255 [Mycena olivaceomarginata]|nr:hypothetical protein B0H14DRAFT_2601255 [Mycena olivaceomarginata]